jgi:hypothetical protein
VAEFTLPAVILHPEFDAAEIFRAPAAEVQCRSNERPGCERWAKFGGRMDFAVGGKLAC